MRSRVVREMCWSIAFFALAAAVVALGAIVARGGEPQVVLWDFYADWCGPCKTMTATVDRLAAAGCSVRRVNVDREAAVAASHHVDRLPCFIAFIEGREIDRVVGTASYERLQAMVARPPARKEAKSLRPAAPRAEREECHGQPRPAWRYERPVGHRAAVVRVYCTTAAAEKSIGSGILVRWKKRIVILTARHVVKDAKSIWIETHAKKPHQVRVLKCDATWDCAVLEPLGELDDVAPAEMEFGAAAMQTAGSRLESCGYGPDGRLACNAGVFQGYRRSEQTPAGPDDWMVLSGPARSGDSGGPIFNPEGHVVGVLWGSDGQNVVGVQAGRVQKLLDEAVTLSEEGGKGKGEGGGDCRMQNAKCKSQIGGATSPTGNMPSTPSPLRSRPSPLAPQPSRSNLPPVNQTSMIQRQPTPAEGTVAVQDCLQRLLGKKKSPPAPLPQPAIQSDADTQRVLADIDSKLATLVEQRQPKPAEQPHHAPSPLLAGLCILCAVAAGFVIYFAAQSKS